LNFKGTAFLSQGIGFSSVTFALLIFMRLIAAAVFLFFCFVLPENAGAQSPLDSTRKGFGRAKVAMFFKRNLDFKNGFRQSRLKKSKKHMQLSPAPMGNVKYTLVFEDNFDSFNTRIWQIGQPWGRFHGQLPHQYYGDSEVFVKDGILHLQNRYAPKTFQDGDSLIRIPYGTGLINTYYSKQFTYGYFAIRSKNPTGPATWPAFWLTGRNNWPPEIDIFEMYGKSTGRTIHEQTMTLHFGKIETNTKTHLTKSVHLKKDTDTAFHIYSCLWEPGKVDFYTDGVKVRSIKLNRWMEQFYREPMYLIVNNAVDHRYLKYIDNTALPVSLEVDWIRVYSPEKP
jgi:beta-glucanase (GH16 family)